MSPTTVREAGVGTDDRLSGLDRVEERSRAIGVTDGEQDERGDELRVPRESRSKTRRLLSERLLDDRDYPLRVADLMENARKERAGRGKAADLAALPEPHDHSGGLASCFAPGATGA